MLPYSGKFSWGPIFAEGQSSKFSRFNFRGCAHSCSLYTVQLCLFRGSNFRGYQLIRENRENWTPRKFPSIRYAVWKSVRQCAPGWLSWSMGLLDVWEVFSTSRASESQQCIEEYGNDRHACRFSSGLTLQAKVDLSSQTEDPTLVSTSSSRRQSFHRSIGSGSHRYSLLTEEPSEER